MNAFERNIINIYGEQGKAWLADVPRRVQELSEKWGLSDSKLAYNMSYNYVKAALRGSTPVILKLGFEGLDREARALKAFAGRGVVEVLEEEEGALLIARAVPGVSLKSYFPQRDAESVQVVCNMMKCLQHPAFGFPHISDWLAALDTDWDIPYLKQARLLRDRLLTTLENPVLLHGDLHHDNILQNSSEWVVIDPKGVIGEPAFEAAVFIRNPTLRLLNTDIITNRIHLFAQELAIEPGRIRDWCVVEGVLSWIWSLEDGVGDGGHGEYIKVLEGVIAL